MLLPLWNPVNQFNYKNGTLLVGGRVYIYYRGRSRLATIYSDELGTIQNNPVQIDNNGRATVYVDTNYMYTVVITDARNQELFSQDLDAEHGLTLSDLGDNGLIYIIEGDGTIRIDTTSGSNWTKYELSTNNKPLGVVEPLYWETDTEEESVIGLHTEGLVSGISADFTELSGKVDEISGDVSYLSGASDYLSGVAEQKLDKSLSSEFYPTSNPSGFIGNDDLSNYQPISGMTAYQEKGDYYSASNPSGFITEEDLD